MWLLHRECTGGGWWELGWSTEHGDDTLRKHVQHSFLETPVDGEAWQATVLGVTKSWTTERLTRYSRGPLMLLNMLRSCFTDHRQVLRDLGHQWYWGDFRRESPRGPSGRERESLPKRALQGPGPGAHQDRQAPPAGIPKVLLWACGDAGFPVGPRGRHCRKDRVLTHGHCGLRQETTGDERDARVTSGPLGRLSLESSRAAA